MADLALRFHRDPLVLSAPIDELLARQDVDASAEREFLDLLEPETVFELQKLDHMVGAQCMVTNTYDITQARLAHKRFENQSAEIASSSVRLLKQLQPQHIIASIGPTLLPIDPDSRASLKQNRDQYARAAQDFGEGIDAFLLDGMASITDLKCALMGVRMVSDLPILASVNVEEDGTLRGRDTSLEEAIAAMVDLQASVVGFSAKAKLSSVLALVKRAVAATELPLLVQLEVGEHDERDVNPGFRPVELTDENPYRTSDALFDAANALLPAGVQFLRAVGHATPSYTGALVIATDGRTCAR